MNSEASFLFSTFNEFYKCWRSGTNSRLFIESVNGKAFINFSAYIGYPDNAHFKPWHHERNPSKRPRKKSAKKIKRDNDRAARFQESKRKEAEAVSTSKSPDKPEAFATSSPGAESAMTVSDLEFSFASPLPENLRQDSFQDTSMFLSDKKDQKKLEEDNSLNNSNFEFQGEEEEVQENINHKLDDKLEIECPSDLVETFSKHPAVKNIQKLGKELVDFLHPKDLIDYELDISISDKNVVLNSDCISDLETTIRKHADSGIHAIFQPVGLAVDYNKLAVLGSRPGLPATIKSDYLKTAISLIDNFKEQAIKLFTTMKQEDLCGEMITMAISI